MCGFCHINAFHRETHYFLKKVLKNLTRLDKYEKISIGSVFPMYLENVEYSVLYIGNLAVFPYNARAIKLSGYPSVFTSEKSSGKNDV